MESFDDILKKEENNERLYSSKIDIEIDDEIEEVKDTYDYYSSGRENLDDTDFILIRDKKKKCKIPFIIIILIFTIILLISSLIILLLVSLNYKEEYTFKQNIYLKPSISGHNYARLKFKNNLEIVLAQVHPDDKAGGAISIDAGYLDKKFPPGLIKYAFLSLRNNDQDSLTQLRDYMGDFAHVSEEFYSSSYFTILNSGFQSYLKNFQDYTSYSSLNNTVKNILIRDLVNSRNNLLEREKNLIEYLVYDIKDENGEDIWNKGIYEEIMEKIDNNVSIIYEAMDYLLEPSRVKFFFCSHYKMSLMKKYILHDFKKIINAESNVTNDTIKDNNNTYYQYYDHLNTNKIICFEIDNKDNNYIKIIYYINNTNVSLSQLYIDSGYFNYIKYILQETNENSLYYNLNKISNESNNYNISIKSLSSNFEIVLKSRIKFTINIELNHYSYNNIIKIAQTVYEYMNKIISHINNISPNDERTEELYKIINQNFTFTEDIHEGEFYKNKAKDLFYKDNYDYYLKEVWLPPNLSKNSTAFKYYINQLIPENSVVIIGLNEDKVIKYKLNKNNSDIYFIFQNMKSTKYLNLKYSINDLSLLIKNNNNKDELTTSIKYYKNNYISKYNESSILLKDNSNNNANEYELINDNNGVLKIFWLKNNRYKLPKVYINFYFFHPFLRPINNETSNIKDEEIFYLPMLFISYLERKINLTLADAIRSGNIFKISYIENYIYLDIFAYSDIVFDIIKEIKNILNCDIYQNINNNYEIYRDFVLENLVNYGANNNFLNIEKLKYTYYQELTKEGILPPIYNFYNFNSSHFNNNNSIPKSLIDNEYHKYIKPPILHGYILGYYEKNEAKNIFNLLNNSYSIGYFDSVLVTIYNDSILLNADDFVKLNLEKKKLKKNKSNYTEILFNNRAISFLNFVPFSHDNRVIVEMLKNSIRFLNISRTFTINIQSINQKDIYLILSYSLFTFINCTKAIEEIITRINLDEVYKNMTENIDIIGGRYYYLKKNMDDEYDKTPLNMKDCAISYSYYHLYSMNEAQSYYIDIDDYKNFTKTIDLLLKGKYYYEFRGN